MKNLASHVLASLLACQPLLSQIATPMFEMPMYFEDAAGHKDTLVVGYDTAASGQNLNPQFGEVLIETPFDSVFEVRAIHWDDSDLETSKKIIESYEHTGGLPCGVSGGMKIMISANYPPVTISYDSTLFGTNSCRGNSILSPDWGIFTLQYWWDAQVFYCLRNTSEVIDSLQDHAGVRFLEELEIEGQGIQEVPGFFLVFREEGPCTDSMSSTQEFQQVSSGMAYPNPANDWVAIKIPEYSKPIKISLSDTAGRLVECPASYVQQNEVQIDVRHLSSGLYFVTVISKMGRQLHYRFFKM